MIIGYKPKKGWHKDWLLHFNWNWFARWCTSQIEVNGMAERVVMFAVYNGVFRIVETGPRAERQKCKGRGTLGAEGISITGGGFKFWSFL